MSKIIDFSKYKKESDEKKRLYVKLEKLKEENNKERFNLGFLELVDAFMSKEYPDYYWKFEHFLNEIENAKERNN